MIRFCKGNMFEDDAEAVVVTVNCVGVMGKGVALIARDLYPKNFENYRKMCRQNLYIPGCVHMFIEDNKKVINFATKNHWRNPSHIGWIQKGLAELRRLIQDKSIKSIAVPPVGCGNGKLDWIEVEPLVKKWLEDLDCDVRLYAPETEVKF